MSSGRLGRMAHQLGHVSRQRWGLIAAALIAAAAASTSTALAAGHQTSVVFALIIGLAVASVMSPDTHAATAVEVIVVWQWLASTDDPTNAWAIPTALCLFLFHTVVALMAVTPTNANVDRSMLLRWSRRSAYVVVATIGMWALVVVLHERRASGSAAVTLAGFVMLTVLMVATRALSAARESRS